MGGGNYCQGHHRSCIPSSVKKFFELKPILKNGVILNVFRQKARKISVSVRKDLTGATNIQSRI
jgi:hypothetical protein